MPVPIAEIKRLSEDVVRVVVVRGTIEPRDNNVFDGGTSNSGMLRRALDAVSNEVLLSSIVSINMHYKTSSPYADNPEDVLTIIVQHI